jgi:hypothetical protein
LVESDGNEMNNKLMGGWCCLVLVSLAALAACVSPAGTPAALSTAAPAAAPTATTNKSAVHFYEFYSPM